jgi:DNA-binding beta-propeller fold protein YncE
MRKTIRAFALLAYFILFLSERLDAVCDQAWVGDNFGNVVVISTETQMQTSVFSPGDEVASGIVFTPDGTQVFLTDSTNGIWAIDASTQMSTKIATLVGANDIVMSPNGQFAYVAVGTAGMGRILKVDTVTHAVTPLNAIPYLLNAQGIAITPDGSQLYLVGEQTVLVIDPSNGNVLHTIIIPTAIELFKVAITPNGALAYVTDVGSFGGGHVFQINTSSFSVAPVSTGAFLPFFAPYDVAINPNGQFAYVTDEFNNSVYVIQISSNTVVNELFDPSILAPQGVAVTFDGSFIYVANFSSPNVVSVINTSTFAIHDVFTSAVQPKVIAISPPCVASQIKGRIVENKDFWQTNIFSQLCWNAPVAFTPVQYLIFRNGKQVGAVNGNQTFFEDNYLRPDKTYHYSIFAVNNANMRFLVGTITLNTE